MRGAVWHGMVSWRFCGAAWSGAAWCGMAWRGVALRCVVSYHVVSYHVVSYHVVSYHVVSSRAPHRSGTATPSSAGTATVRASRPRWPPATVQHEVSGAATSNPNHPTPETTHFRSWRVQGSYRVLQPRATNSPGATCLKRRATRCTASTNWHDEAHHHHQIS